MERLSALLAEPADDAEFEALWSQVMTIAPTHPEPAAGSVKSDLIARWSGPTTDHRPSGAVPIAPTGSAEMGTSTSRPPEVAACSGQEPVQPRKRPTSPRTVTRLRNLMAPPRRRPRTAIRAPGAKLVTEAASRTRTLDQPVPTRIATRPLPVTTGKPTPIVGSKVQRSSVTTARKWQGLLETPPPLPRQPVRREAHAKKAKASLMAIFGDALSDLDEEDDRKPVPQPSRPAGSAPAGNKAAGTPPTSPPKPVSGRPATTNRAPSTTSTSGLPSRPVMPRPLPTPTTTPASGDVTTRPSTTAATPPATAHTARHNLPSVPVRVREDLVVHVPYHAARISRVYKVRLANLRYTLRFDRTGRCHYVREFPA